MSPDTQFGEVIQADSQLLAAECHALYGAPAFGSFVRAVCAGSARDHYGVVTAVSTGAFDGNRLVQAHKLPPGELEERKPHLPSLLRTQFEARLVGYGEQGACVAGTPPTPPRLHCWVYAAADDEVRRVTESGLFLRTLVFAPEVPLEDLLVCAITSAQAAWNGSAPVVQWGKYLARLLRGQYVTLESVLSRLAAPAIVPATVPPDGAGRGWEAPLPLAGDAQPANGGRKYSSGQVDPFAE